MHDNLKNDTLNALTWSFLEQIGQKGITFVVSIFLARLLFPKDFGLVAMLAVFIPLGHAFINAGFGQALIQKRNTTYIDECSIFYFNIFVAFLVSSLLFLAAPLIGSFYNQHRLVSITQVLSFGLIINSFGLIQWTLFQKKLDFKSLLKISILTSIASGIISITMALKGFGVWSLVALSICNEIFRAIFLWCFNTWRPSLIFSIISLKSLFTFGSKIFIISLTNSVFVNIYQLIIGKFYTVTALGFYSRANSLYKYPLNIMNSAVSQVTFPVFSKIQDEKDRLKKATHKSLTMLTLITFPLMIGIIVVAKPLVVILLTEKWLPCVPYLQLLCIIGMIDPISRINLNVLNAQGYSNIYLKIDVLVKILIIISVIITYRLGITAMIYGQIITFFIAFYLYSYYTGKLLGYTITDQIKDLFPNFVISSVMGTFVFAIKYLPISNQITLLAIQIITGILTYTGLCYLFKISSFTEIIKIIKLKLS